jgi:hypothetical protein
MKRLDKTSNSILISWAINNAVNTISDQDKANADSWETIEKAIRHRYPFFIELYQEWMLENAVEVEPEYAPLDNAEAIAEGIAWQKQYESTSKIAEINAELQAEEEAEKNE